MVPARRFSQAISQASNKTRIEKVEFHGKESQTWPPAGRTITGQNGCRTAPPVHRRAGKTVAEKGRRTASLFPAKAFRIIRLRVEKGEGRARRGGRQGPQRQARQ